MAGADTFERRHHVFAAIAEPRIDHGGEPREQIDDRKDEQLCACRQLIVDKIHRPGLVRTCRLCAIITQLGLDPLLRRFCPQLQAPFRDKCERSSSC